MLGCLNASVLHSFELCLSSTKANLQWKWLKDFFIAASIIIAQAALPATESLAASPQRSLIAPRRVKLVPLSLLL